MNRFFESWKLFILMIVLGAPVGYWLLSNPSSQPSAVYAQQIADAQQARGGLDNPADEPLQHRAGHLRHISL